jgi:hypothetical protein
MPPKKRDQPTAVFTFEKDGEKVNRPVRIEIPPQRSKGEVKAAPGDLPTDYPKEIPKSKGGGILITSVINLQVTIGEKQVFRFSPPLRMWITYEDPGDPEKARPYCTKPKLPKPCLTVVSLWKKGDKWRWKKYPRTVNPEKRTIYAEISTLLPNDPEGVGSD